MSNKKYCDRIDWESLREFEVREDTNKTSVPKDTTKFKKTTIGVICLVIALILLIVCDSYFY